MSITRLIRAGAFAIAATVIAVSVAVLGANTNARLDFTAGGEHELGARTQARLRALDAPVELVIAVARDRIDRRARDRVDDVLDALGHTSPLLTVTVIDAGSPQGPVLYRELIGRLEARESAARVRIAEAAGAIVSDARSLEAKLGSLDTAAETASQADPAHTARLQEFAAFARVASRQLGESTDTTAASALSIADFAGQLAPQLAVIEQELASMENEAPSEEARLRINNAYRVAGSLRDQAAVLAEAGARLGRTDLDRISEVLETGEAALLIGPPREDGPGLVAIDLDELYPPAELFELAGSAAQVATSDRAEQLVSSALSVLADHDRPIVVFVHGETARWVGKAGVMTGLLGRLDRGGIDHAEWAAVLESDPPDLVALDPDRHRPVVWFVISPNSAASANPDNPQSRSGVQRAQRVGEVVASLVAHGEPVLVNLGPSVFPTFGDTDPIAAPLEPLGVAAISGTPVLKEVSGAARAMTTPMHRLVPPSSQHPVGVAVAGLPTAMEWPVPLELSGDAEGLLILPATGDRWAESQWLRLWRMPRTQRRLLVDQPVFNADQGDGRGPWIVAAAARGPETSGRRARAVVVGSNTWFLDQSWSAQQVVQGRPLLVNPGNVELFDAAVLWLAGRDELISPSPSARPIALIRPVSEGVLTALRWSLIGGLPMLILLAGSVWRVLRG